MTREDLIDDWQNISRRSRITVTRHERRLLTLVCDRDAEKGIFDDSTSTVEQFRKSSSEKDMNILKPSAGSFLPGMTL
jgi:hypothetical protein